MPPKKNVLVARIYNSACRRMEKAFCAKSEIFLIAASAAIKTGTLNPPSVPSMREIGLDISAQSIDTIDSVIRQRDHSDSISTVFDTADDQCSATV